MDEVIRSRGVVGMYMHVALSLAESLRKGKNKMAHAARFLLDVYHFMYAYWLRVFKEMQPLRNLFSIRVTPLNPAKSMEVNALQSAKKLCPRLVTLPNPVKLMKVNDVQPDKKLSPRIVTLLNPEKLMEVNALQRDKK